MSVYLVTPLARKLTKCINLSFRKSGQLLKVFGCESGLRECIGRIVSFCKTITNFGNSNSWDSLCTSKWTEKYVELVLDSRGRRRGLRTRHGKTWSRREWMMMSMFVCSSCLLCHHSDHRDDSREQECNVRWTIGGVARPRTTTRNLGFHVGSNSLWTMPGLKQLIWWRSRCGTSTCNLVATIWANSWRVVKNTHHCGTKCSQSKVSTQCEHHPLQRSRCRAAALMSSIACPSATWSVDNVAIDRT